ncbi:MAG TPA: Holliday junction branch migration protein RuvA [Candidatus Limnocylindria bacterium]|nr:Holliday junction branch migration protein RuvA [Candidatus Limnocylindria bacterium]
MIALIRGDVVARGSDHVIVDVRGVGYKVFVPRHPSSDAVTLHTHQVIREDAHQLYGFETREELALFEMLIGVSGVGPKAAMSILGVARPAQVASAIASGDVAALSKAPGVGKKTAERLIVDLKGKVARAGIERETGAMPVDDEAAAALQALGYSAAEALAALRSAPAATTASTEERVTAALRSAGRASVAGR